MNYKFPLLALAAACSMPLLAFANKGVKTIQSPFTSSAELGFLYKSGNTKSADINAGLSVKYKHKQWLSTLDLNLLAKQTEQAIAGSTNTQLATTAQKWTINSKTNYTLEKTSKNYIYSNVFYEDNRFTSYNSQASISAGWGRNWYKTDKTSLYADIGPGFKRDVTKATELMPSETQSSLIVQAQVLYLHQINDFVKFQQALSAKIPTQAGDNSTYRSESSITTNLIDTLQLKFTVTLDYNTRVNINSDKLDTQTAVTMVYGF